MLITAKVPAEIKNVEAMDDFVYARKIHDMVTPISTEYTANRMVAVLNESVLIRDVRNHTKANWAMMIPKKLILLEKIILSSSSEPDTR